MLPVMNKYQFKSDGEHDLSLISDGEEGRSCLNVCRFWYAWFGRAYLKGLAGRGGGQDVRGSVGFSIPLSWFLQCASPLSFF